MIPTIIYLLLRRYRLSNPEKAKKLTRMLRKASRLIFLFIVLLLISLFALPQPASLEYSIKRKGSEIGTMSFSSQLSGNKTVLKIESALKTRFLFTITAKALEEAVFENGIMIWSTVYQKLNSNERVNKKTKLNGNNYIVTVGQKSELVRHYPIRFNMVCLFVNEPVNITTIYSDNFQRFLVIQRLGEHHYRIDFPDGNYNEYHYSNGLCSKVEVKHSFYSSTIELKNK
jgi:hypothetical protein